MGEKLLAQRVLALLRANYGSRTREGTVLIEWVREQRGWLWPDRDWPVAPAADAPDALDWEALPALIGEIGTEEPAPALDAGLDRIAALLDLDPFDRELLRVTALLERLPQLSNLRTRLLYAGTDLAGLAGCLAGAAPAEANGRVRRTPLLSLGLICLSSDCSAGGLDLSLDWRVARLLDEGLADEERMIAALAGIPQTAALAPEDFAQHADAFRLLVRLLDGALQRRAAGVSILIHGPPGTGKTELARTLAGEAGAALFAVGEADMDGAEPSRKERLQALTRAERLLARRGGSVLLFDEMEDLFAEAGISAGGGRRAGSKIFVNRLLEQARVPIIWTSNAIDGIDPAHLRRMSYVLRMDHPSPSTRARIVARAAASEGVPAAAEGLTALLTREPETASVARVALRTAALAGGDAGEAKAAARSLLLGLRCGRALPPRLGGGELDLALYDTDRPVAGLVEQLAAPGAAADFSLLLTGPPGTGKTALAAYLAERLERPLQVKRTSDLLCKWVGGTEANIAAAFADARDEGAVLLFDEADSLLLDRGDARHSWEITQVNELLTWMDDHPLPFCAATNFSRRLDPAALRRFVFKIDLRPLSAAAAEQAFARFFGMPAPAALAQIGGLTPGDFAVVKRQLRYRPEATAAEVVVLLEAEAKAKPERAARIGF